MFWTLCQTKNGYMHPFEGIVRNREPELRIFPQGTEGLPASELPFSEKFFSSCFVRRCFVRRCFVITGDAKAGAIYLLWLASHNIFCLCTWYEPETKFSIEMEYELNITCARPVCLRQRLSKVDTREAPSLLASRTPTPSQQAGWSNHWKYYCCFFGFLYSQIEWPNYSGPHF